MNNLVRAASLLAIFFLAVFLIFLTNQTLQIVQLATAIHPIAGKATLWTLLSLYMLLLVSAVYLWVAFPKAVRTPRTEDPAEQSAFRDLLAKRLSKNPIVSRAKLAPSDPEFLTSALALLDREAERRTKNAATRVFLSTAVSQSGRLDAFFVLAAQCKLVWEIVHIYSQRPSPGEIVRLYGNVGASVMAANSLEEVDLVEQVQPVIAAVIGSLTTAIPTLVLPALSSIGSLVAASMLEGTGNAFLTLRIGAITQIYCSSTREPARASASRKALAMAIGQLGGITASAGVAIVKAIATGAAKAGESAVDSTIAGLRSAGAKLNPFAGGNSK